MKTFLGTPTVFACLLFITLSTAQSRNTSRQSARIEEPKTWQYHDSLACAKLFNRDTIGAMEQYQTVLKIDPDNIRAKKNLEKLTNLYIKAGQSFYHIDP